MSPMTATRGEKMPRPTCRSPCGSRGMANSTVMEGGNPLAIGADAILLGGLQARAGLCEPFRPIETEHPR